MSLLPGGGCSSGNLLFRPVTSSLPLRKPELVGKWSLDHYWALNKRRGGGGGGRGELNRWPLKRSSIVYLSVPGSPPGFTLLIMIGKCSLRLYLCSLSTDLLFCLKLVAIVSLAQNQAGAWNARAKTQGGEAGERSK